MKILLIGFTKLAYMPYMNFYLSQVLQGDNEVHLLYWNRDLKSDIAIDRRVILHEFKQYQEDEVSKVSKIKNFIRYRSNTKKLFAKNRYDLVIVMHTTPAVLLSTILKKKYKKRYIFDFRDLTYERNFLYGAIVKSLVKNSLFTFVSSDAYRDYLPSVDHIYTSHNILLKTINFREVRRQNERHITPLRIRFWGFIRHEKINKKIIDNIGNDNRFELHYHGREQETAQYLKHYCKEKHINNVFFNGSYYPEERYDFAKKTDLLHNIYENDKKTDKAMGNKYYDGILFCIPQLCNVGSHMGDLVNEKEVGFQCDPYSTSFADDIYNYYKSLNWKKFDNDCDKEVDRILNEYNEGEKVILEVLKKDD